MNRHRSGSVLVLALLGGLMVASPALAQDELFVANAGRNSVTVYSRIASGDTVPLRTLSGPATGLSFVQNLAVDVTNNELFVANGSGPAILVYSLTASGNTAPLRILTGAATGMSPPIFLALDATNNELFVANTNQTITVYGRTASGNTAPVRTLSTVPAGNNPISLTLDLTNNELIVGTSGSTIDVYSRTASGNAPTLRRLGGAATGLFGPIGLGVDITNNELFVANGGLNPPSSITVYSRTASGNSAPLRTLTGPATGLVAAHALALDLTNNELYVANTFNANTVTVYARTASGNAAPLRTLGGPATGLSGPVGLAVPTAPAPPPPAPSTTTTLSNPTGGNVTPGTSVTDGATVTGGAGQPTPTGTVTFFLCQPSEVTPGQGCVSAGTQIGAVKTLSASGQATSDATTNTTAMGQYCWRVAYSGDGSFAASNHTDATDECFTVLAPPPPPPTALVAAVLPSSRSVQVGITATAFVTILNTGPNPAVNVGVSLASPIPATFIYNQTDCATNAVIGGANVPVTIPSGAPPLSQACFVISITPTATFAPTEVAFNFAGINTPPVSTLVGINTLLMSASLTPVPDIVALAATATRDGILHITAPATSGAFVVATSNVGASGLITASANTGATALPLALSICQTDPAIGVCISSIGPSVTVQINAGETPTFAIFATASGAIVLDAATNRIFVVFADNGNVIRGRTSVAITAQ